MMKLILEPTDMREAVQGIPCRIWKGETDKGVPVCAWVAIVQPNTLDPDEIAEFEEALRRVPYRRQLASFEFRMISDD